MCELDPVANREYVNVCNIILRHSINSAIHIIDYCEQSCTWAAVVCQLSYPYKTSDIWVPEIRYGRGYILIAAS
jgi:hypothetical protein